MEPPPPPPPSPPPVGLFGFGTVDAGDLDPAEAALVTSLGSDAPFALISCR